MAPQKKSPAFQFYPSDFLGSPSVRAMTVRQIGLYTLGLCLDWDLGGMTEEELRSLAESQRMTPAEFAEDFARICVCFRDKKSRLFNARLDAERKKQREWRRKSSQGGKLSAQRRLKGGSRVVEPKTNIPSLSPTPVSTTTGRAVARHPSWLVPICAVWERYKGKGSFKWGKAGKLLKPLHEAGHSGEKIAANLERYIPKAGEFVSLARFAETFADHDEIKLSGPPVVDGWMSPEVERLTKPERVA